MFLQRKWARVEVELEPKETHLVSRQYFSHPMADGQRNECRQFTKDTAAVNKSPRDHMRNVLHGMEGSSLSSQVEGGKEERGGYLLEP